MLLRTFAQRLLTWLRFILKPDFAAQIVLMHPTPEEVKPGTILVVGDDKYQKWVCFRCPGRCGENISLPLNKNQRPCWAVSIDWLGRPTIHPSVRQLNECRCHFWIRQGCVDWCPND
jgi:hypothetical protein